jgi:hypothetical protein
MKLLHLYTDEAQMHGAYSIEYTLSYVGKGIYKTNIKNRHPFLNTKNGHKS